MGNPFGLGGTVTAGIVSAEGRDIGDGPYDSFLQIDAPINKGNSGGPLFDQQGKVVGMNTAILSPSGGSIGIGFAIPSDTIKTIVNDLIKNGHVTRGYLGVEAQSVDEPMAKALHLPDDGQGPLNGALIAQVEPDSPAAQAGLKAGDVIEKVDGATIHTPRDLAVRSPASTPAARRRSTSSATARRRMSRPRSPSSRPRSRAMPGRPSREPTRAASALLWRR